MIDKHKKLIITAAVLLFFFLFSLLFYNLNLKGKIRRVLFFPEIKTARLLPEIRYLKKQKTYFRNVGSFIEELFLGSTLPGRSKLVPTGTEIITVFKTDHTITLNLSDKILVHDEKAILDFRTSIQALVNNILFNFKDLKEIIFYINGELLPAEILKDSGESEKIYIHKFDKLLLK